TQADHDVLVSIGRGADHREHHRFHAADTEPVDHMNHAWTPVATRPPCHCSACAAAAAASSSWAEVHSAPPETARMPTGIDRPSRRLKDTQNSKRNGETNQREPTR